jgi:hypothetical protein
MRTRAKPEAPLNSIDSGNRLQGRRTPAARVSAALAGVALAGVLTGCGEGGTPRKQGDVTPADVVAGRAQAGEHFESPGGKFAIDFPDTWRGAYRTVERADTTAGARFAVEFVLKPDAAWKVQPQALLVVRIFPRAAWEKVVARPGEPLAAKLAERGDDVFALSLPSATPYAKGTPAAQRFDELVLSAIQAPGPLRLTPR